MTKFAQRLKEVRTYYGMTQAEVAKCLNFSSAAIGNYERGVRNPGLEEVTLLAGFFKVSVDYLVGNKDELLVDRQKTKMIRYSVTDYLRVPENMEETEIELLIRMLADGKMYSWEEV